MPLGLGHIWVLLFVYGAIVVAAIVVIRAVVQAFRRRSSALAAQTAALEAIQRGLKELKDAVEALQRR